MLKQRFVSAMAGPMKPLLHGSFDSFWVYGDFVFGDGCIKNNLENKFIDFVLKIASVRFILNSNV